MMKLSLGLAMIAFAAAAPTVAQAQDQWYKFDYTNGGTGQHAYGSLDIDLSTNTATAGFIYVDTGPVTGFWTLIPGSGSDANFFWDSFIDPTNPLDPIMTGAGLLFADASEEINIWRNGPGNFSLYGAGAGGTYQPADDGGSFTLTQAPAPGSAALLGLGGLISLRRRRR